MKIKSTRILPSKSILAFATAHGGEFTPRAVDHLVISPRTANNLCNRLAKDKKLRLIRPGVSGSKAAPPIYAIA